MYFSWGSTYSMIAALRKLEELCRECVEHGDDELIFSDDQWLKLKEIQETLEPAFVATKKLQTPDLTLPDIKKVIDIAQTRTHELGITHK